MSDTSSTSKLECADTMTKQTFIWKSYCIGLIRSTKAQCIVHNHEKITVNSCKTKTAKLSSLARSIDVIKKRVVRGLCKIRAENIIFYYGLIIHNGSKWNTRNSHWLSYLKVVYIMAIRIENCKKQRFWLPSIKAKTAKLIMMVAKWNICFEILRLESWSSTNSTQNSLLFHWFSKFWFRFLRH